MKKDSKSLTRLWHIYALINGVKNKIKAQNKAPQIRKNHALYALVYQKYLADFPARRGLEAYLYQLNLRLN